MQGDKSIFLPESFVIKMLLDFNTFIDSSMNLSKLNFTADMALMRSREALR